MSVHSSRGRPFARTRAAILHRDNYRCARCGRAAGASELEVHHKRAKRDGGADAPGNLETLCRGCHIRLEKRAKNPERAAWEARLGV